VDLGVNASAGKSGKEDSCDLHIVEFVKVR